jgi:radical SAM protein with 4Fe4S-binding SPASM domain
MVPVQVICDTPTIRSAVVGDQILSIDKQYKFNSVFNMKTGFYMRSGIMENGVDTGKDPFMTSFPTLLDVGIMGFCNSKGVCKAGGIDCYQSGFTKEEPHMSLELFEKIITQCRGKVFEIAAGGRGNPDKHPQFKQIMQLCRDNFIAPNYTTSGIGLTDEAVQVTKDLCGAVAVSWQRQEHTLVAIDKFIKADCTTNVHYVLSNKTIDELIMLIKENKIPAGINALIILNYKNIGQGDVSNVITGNEPNLKELFSLLDSKLPFKIGLDSCSCQFVGKFMKNVSTQSVASCDSGVFSAYISPSGVLTPCSFDQKQVYGVDLNTHTLEEAWNSLQFELFRDKQRFGLASGKCQSCKHHIDVCKPCVLVPDINICSN